MKAWWLAQSERINALSLRERIFMFVSVLVCCLALVDVVWLTPAQVAHKQWVQRFEQQNAELKRLSAEVRTSAKPMDAIQSLRRELAALQARIDHVNRQIQHALPSKGQCTALPQVLLQLLRRHEGVSLERTVAMAAEPAGPDLAQSADALALTRQTVGLTVRGPYPELVRYVQTLEKALPYVRWGKLKLHNDGPVWELELQLVLLGVQP